MTDIERNANYKRKHDEIVERLLGPKSPYPVPSAIETRLTAPMHSSATYINDIRIGHGTNPSAFDPWLHEFNKKMRECNGKIVTYVDTPLAPEIGAPIK